MAVFSCCPSWAGLLAWLTYALKTSITLATFALVVSVTFPGDNRPEKGDLQWILKGCMCCRSHVLSSTVSNPGSIFKWCFLPGISDHWFRLVMDMIVPGLVYERGIDANHAHDSWRNPVLMLAMFLAHAYLGSVGMDGAYEGTASRLC
jgi:formate dehydrogenase subunit gamma